VNPFQSLRDYEEYIYTLKQHFPSIQRSTLIVVQRGRRVAVLQGELTFAFTRTSSVIVSPHRI